MMIYWDYTVTRRSETLRPCAKARPPHLPHQTSPIRPPPSDLPHQAWVHCGVYGARASRRLGGRHFGFYVVRGMLCTDGLERSQLTCRLTFRQRNPQAPCLSWRDSCSSWLI